MGTAITVIVFAGFIVFFMAVVICVVNKRDEGAGSRSKCVFGGDEIARSFQCDRSNS